MFHKNSRKNSIAVYLMENVFDSYLLQVHPKTLEKQPWVWTKKKSKNAPISYHESTGKRISSTIHTRIRNRITIATISLSLFSLTFLLFSPEKK